MTDVRLLPIETFTYVSDAHHTTSWIDHVIMSSSLHDYCSAMSVLYGHVTSDHRPIFLKNVLGRIT